MKESMVSCVLEYFPEEHAVYVLRPESRKSSATVIVDDEKDEGTVMFSFPSMNVIFVDGMDSEQIQNWREYIEYSKKYVLLMAKRSSSFSFVCKMKRQERFMNLKRFMDCSL